MEINVTQTKQLATNKPAKNAGQELKVGAAGQDVPADAAKSSDTVKLSAESLQLSNTSSQSGKQSSVLENFGQALETARQVAEGMRNNPGFALAGFNAPGSVKVQSLLA